jgi:hypothetical protein
VSCDVAAAVQRRCTVFVWCLGGCIAGQLTAAAPCPGADLPRILQQQYVHHLHFVPG